jgi:hypothetical protein
MRVPYPSPTLKALLCLLISAAVVMSGLSLIGAPLAIDCRAASISFSVAEEVVNVSAQKDGSVNIDY